MVVLKLDSHSKKTRQFIQAQNQMQLKIYNEIIVCLETIVYDIVLNVLNVRPSSQSITFLPS